MDASSSTPKCPTCQAQLQPPEGLQILAPTAETLQGDDRINWHRLAIHSLYDLQLLGVKIEMIDGVDQKVLEQIDRFSKAIDELVEDGP